jgi:N-formylglutamate amidohydrolase
MIASFNRIGPDCLNWPVILSVPHAGRHYPDDLAHYCRFTPVQLRSLEDRYADRLIGHAQSAGFVGLVAQTPRALIDLNRAEHDVDPGMLSAPLGPTPHLSTKARGGLGLIPRRTANLGEIWRHRLHPDQVRRRIERDYRPYHAALGALLEQARLQFGGAILLDVHSMPPLTSTRDGIAPDIVIGDRFGRSAGQMIAQQAARSIQAAGFRVAFNTPYAGGHILDHHSRPDNNVHGLQIEIDRSLYLDAQLDEPGLGLSRMNQLICRLAQDLSDSLLSQSHPLAAE